MSLPGRKAAFVSLICILFLSPAPAKKKAAEPSASGTVIAPKQKSRSFFSSVDPDVLALVEDGSAESLLQALSALPKSADAPEAARVLSAVAANIMSLCWPSQKYAESVVPAPTANQYLGAISSVRQGIYDYSTGGGDFLSLVLPSLVLTVSSIRNDFFDDAKRDLDAARALRADSVLLNYLSGLLALKTEQFPEAEQFFRAAAASSGSDEISMGLSRSLFGEGKYLEAYEIASVLEKKGAGGRDFLKLCAQAALECGETDAAEVYVGKVLAQEPENALFILHRARILVLRGDYIRASSLLDVYARTDTKAKDYLLSRAVIQKEWNKNNALAVETVQSALALYGDDIDVKLLAAELAIASGKAVGGKSAGTLAAEILSEHPKNARALSVQVADFVSKAAWNDAYKASAELLSLPDAGEKAVLSHISICLSSARKDEAFRLASELYGKKPDDEEIVLSYVSVLVATGRASEASRLISLAVPSASQKFKSALYYQKSLLSSGEEAVLADLRASLTANPRNRDALFRLYQIYFAKKEYRKAQYYLKQVVAISPDDESVRALDEQLKSLLAK